MTHDTTQQPDTSFRDNHEIEIPLPDDFHIHLRQGLPLTMYCRDAALSFGRVMVAPDTTPEVRVPRQLEKYRERIIQSARGAHGFDPLMSFYVDSAIGDADIREFARTGAVAGVFYPAASPDVERFFHVFESMSEHGIVLSINAEVPDAFVLDREDKYLPELERIAKRFPDLRIVVEHISSERMLSALLDLPPTVAATITAQHLLYTLDDVAGDVLRPHLFSKPLPRRKEDRDALRKAVFSGNRRLFFGSDSVPQPATASQNLELLPGVYSAPTAIPLLLSLFEKRAGLEPFISFTAINGAEFYGLNRQTIRCRYRRESWDIPERISDVVPLAAGERASWKVVGRTGKENEGE